MAPSPTIPTSFVPKQPVRPAQRLQRSGGNIFLVASVFLLGLAVLGSVGVFLYKGYLAGIRDAKSAEVEELQKNIDTVAVEEFIRTRDRFKTANILLDTHITSSSFFDLLETITLQNVRFDSLSFTLMEERSAEILMAGTARTFNALAAQSSLFAGEKQVKRAIFSDIAVKDDDTVSFTLTATLEPELILMKEDAAPPSPAEAVAPLSGSEGSLDEIIEESAALEETP